MEMNKMNIIVRNMGVSTMIKKKNKNNLKDRKNNPSPINDRSFFKPKVFSKSALSKLHLFIV